MERFEAELSRFQKAIFADATAKRDALLAEEAQRRKVALEEKNDQLLLQAYQQLQAGTARFEKEASTALSWAEMEAKRALLLRREALCQEMFSHVAGRLEEFSKGPDYQAYLQKRLEELEKAGLPFRQHPPGKGRGPAPAGPADPGQGPCGAGAQPGYPPGRLSLLQPGRGLCGPGNPGRRVGGPKGMVLCPQRPGDRVTGGPSPLLLPMPPYGPDRRPPPRELFPRGRAKDCEVHNSLE